MHPKKKELLLQVLSQYTAPYRERFVRDLLFAKLNEAKVPYFLDPVGNIVIGAKSKADYLKAIHKKSTDPLRISMAHMDHPGFHGKRWLPDGTLEILWQGGAPTRHLEGTPLWFASPEGLEGFGKILSAKLKASGKTIETAVVQTPDDLAKRCKKVKDIFGGFAFRAPVWEEGELLYTKGADDLVGTFSVLSTALDLWKTAKGRKTPFLGLITRAEEVGFIGAIGHLDLGWLKSAKRPILFISIETSRTLPGAEIGKGPVVRLGDRHTVFDAHALKVFLGVAKKVLPEKHQARVMDGGTCEATAAMAYGFPAVGISIPLGNYHNESFQGGPDSRGENGPAPEFVHQQDIEGVLHLCHGLLRPGLPWQAPWAPLVAQLRKGFKKGKRLLGPTPYKIG